MIEVKKKMVSLSRLNDGSFVLEGLKLTRNSLPSLATECTLLLRSVVIQKKCFAIDLQHFLIQFPAIIHSDQKQIQRPCFVVDL